MSGTVSHQIVPYVIAHEIVGNLEAALEEFRLIFLRPWGKES